MDSNEEANLVDSQDTVDEGSDIMALDREWNKSLEGRRAGDPLVMAFCDLGDEALAEQAVHGSRSKPQSAEQIEAVTMKAMVRARMDERASRVEGYVDAIKTGRRIQDKRAALVKKENEDSSSFYEAKLHAGVILKNAALNTIRSVR